MRTGKRFAALAVVLAVLLGALPSHAAAAGGTITGETIAAAAGQTVEYRVSLSGNPGLAGLEVRLHYDTSAIALEKGEEGAAPPFARGDFTGKGTMEYTEDSDGLRMIWFHTADVSADGTLFTLRLQVSETAAPGEYPIRLECIAGNTVNAAEQPVPMTCQSGSVTVRTFAPTVTGESLAVQQGSSFDYRVSIQDNPGLTAYNLVVAFDPAVFSLAEDAEGGTCTRGAGSFSGGSMNCKTYSDGGIQVLWYSAAQAVEDGELFILHFNAKTDAAPGAYPITLVCVEENTQNDAEEPVALACVSGQVAVVDHKVDPEAPFGTLGENGEVIWIYDEDTGAFTFTGTAPEHITGQQPVLAAGYDAAGRMLSVARVASSGESAAAAEGSAVVKLFWISSEYAPLCENAVLELPLAK